MAETQPIASPTAPAAPTVDPADPFQGRGVKLASGGWVPNDHPLAQSQPLASPNPVPGGQANSSGPQTIAGALNTTGTVGANVEQGGQQSVTGAFQQSLLNRLNPAPVDVNNPEISGAIGANRGAEQRAFERNRAMVAERAASQGLDQNATSTQLRGLAQERAGREGQFAGNAVQGLASQRAQELTAALALGGQMLSDNDKLAMQRELAQLQAQVQREQIGSTAATAASDIDLRRQLGEGNLNLGLLNALLGNDQFGKDLSAKLGMFGADLNQRTASDFIRYGT